MAWAAGGTAIGGVFGGPVGAMVGGMAGLIFYFQVMFLSDAVLPFLFFWTLFVRHFRSNPRK